MNFKIEPGLLTFSEGIETEHWGEMDFVGKDITSKTKQWEKEWE